MVSKINACLQFLSTNVFSAASVYPHPNNYHREVSDFRQFRGGVIPILLGWGTPKRRRIGSSYPKASKGLKVNLFPF